MTDTSTAVAAAPLVAAVAPYIVALAGVAVPALVGWGLAEVRKLTGIQVQKAASDTLDAMIEDEVGALVAAASDNLATTSIHVGSAARRRDRQQDRRRRSGRSCAGRRQPDRRSPAWRSARSASGRRA